MSGETWFSEESGGTGFSSGEEGGGGGGREGEKAEGVSYVWKWATLTKWKYELQERKKGKKDERQAPTGTRNKERGEGKE